MGHQLLCDSVYEGCNHISIMRKNIANWGNYPVIESDERQFTFKEQLSPLVKGAKKFIPRGNGRCYGDASLEDETISTLKYNKALAFDTKNGVFKCESGMLLEEVLEIIVPKGWFLPVTPGTKYITIGGAVGSDVHGKNHHVDGSFSNHIVEMELMLADGSLMVCSPVLHPDLFEATCGGMGLTGVITTVTFNLKKIETAYIKQKQIKAKNLEEIIELFEKYKDATYSVAWIDCLKKGKGFGRSILILGEHATIEDLPAAKKANPLYLKPKGKIPFPFTLPSWVLNQFTISVFNFLYYGKNFKRVIDNVVPYEPFFYPLDVVQNWNRGYGKKGFVQYQFVLPLEAKQGLVDILKKISDKGLASFLAVLKVFGKQDSLISFPKEGYTLALDIPIRDGLFEFLDELDQIVLQYGGRLYMSKDARMRPYVLEAGYPRLDEFKSIVKKYNPDHKIKSIQSDRLRLTSK
jgi:decaprenylphospho-beta-D-ribofuranose 2-oxidase